MEKIKLLSDLWNGKEGDTLEVSFIRAEWAVKKGKAVKVIEKIEPKKAKVRNTPKNKAELQPIKNK